MPHLSPDAATLSDDARYARNVGWLIALLFVARLACAAVLPLAADEAYYWSWSKNLAGGFYDHPPMVAYMIRAGTGLAGDTAFGVRLVAVLLGLPATWALWRAAQLLFQSDRLAATTALYFNLTLMVAAGAMLATPDAPLLAAAALLVFGLAKVVACSNGPWWLVVGAIAGAGMLSKYSFLFLGAGILLWLLCAARERHHLGTPWPYLGGLVALVIFLPVLIWNAEHDWISFSKQFGRVALASWSPKYLVELLFAQIGLATPPIFILGWLGLSAFLRGRGPNQSTRVLLSAPVCFMALYFCWHALHSRVEGNWLAPMFPAFALCAAAAVHAVEWPSGWQFTTVAWLQRCALVVGLIFTATVYAQAAFAVIPLGRADPTARQLGAGWPKLGAEIDKLCQHFGAKTVLADSYATTSWLAFYLPSRPLVFQRNERYRWLHAPEPDRSAFDGPVLYVCAEACGDLAAIREQFERVEIMAEKAPRARRGVTIGTYSVFLCEGVRGDPLDYTPPPRFGSR